MGGGRGEEEQGEQQQEGVTPLCKPSCAGPPRYASKASKNVFFLSLPSSPLHVVLFAPASAAAASLICPQTRTWFSLCWTGFLIRKRASLGVLILSKLLHSLLTVSLLHLPLA